MTDREVMQQALEALECMIDDLMYKDHKRVIDISNVAITALRTALEQQAEPVSHAVIAGALFDFMGWLTTRDERLVLSGADEAGPAVEAITAFSKMRGLSLDDAKVQDWQDYTAPPQQQAEPPPEWPLIKNILDEYGLQAICFVAEWKAAQQQAEPTCPDCKAAVLYECVACSSNNYPPKRPWVDMTDGDWEWVADKKETSLDTFAHGAAWAADQLKERNNG